MMCYYLNVHFQGQRVKGINIFHFKKLVHLLISSSRRVVHVAVFLLGDYPESEFYLPTFRNTLFHLHKSYESATSCSETLAHNIQTPRNQPKERIKYFTHVLTIKHITESSLCDTSFATITDHGIRQLAGLAN
jgi:hypothetical protein